jgi:hypothetical protein
MGKCHFDNGEMADERRQQGSGAAAAARAIWTVRPVGAAIGRERVAAVVTASSRAVATIRIWDEWRWRWRLWAGSGWRQPHAGIETTVGTSAMRGTAWAFARTVAVLTATRVATAATSKVSSAGPMASNSKKTGARHLPDGFTRRQEENQRKKREETARARNRQGAGAQCNTKSRELLSRRAREPGGSISSEGQGQGWARSTCWGGGGC